MFVGVIILECVPCFTCLIGNSCLRKLVNAMCLIKCPIEHSCLISVVVDQLVYMRAIDVFGGNLVKWAFPHVILFSFSNLLVCIHTMCLLKYQ